MILPSDQIDKSGESLSPRRGRMNRQYAKGKVLGCFTPSRVLCHAEGAKAKWLRWSAACSRLPKPSRLKPTNAALPRDETGNRRRHLIERLENSATPTSGRTIQSTPNKNMLHLNVDTLYWGTRVMIQRLTEDAAMMKKAETYLSKHFL